MRECAREPANVLPRNSHSQRSLESRYPGNVEVPGRGIPPHRLTRNCNCSANHAPLVVHHNCSSGRRIARLCCSHFRLSGDGGADSQRACHLGRQLFGITRSDVGRVGAESSGGRCIMPSISCRGLERRVTLRRRTRSSDKDGAHLPLVGCRMESLASGVACRWASRDSRRSATADSATMGTEMIWPNHVRIYRAVSSAEAWASESAEPKRTCRAEALAKADAWSVSLLRTL